MNNNIDNTTFTYDFSNDSGRGKITGYNVFPGVTIAFNDFHMQYYDSDFAPGKDFFCIDYCREGRLEYESKEYTYSYVEAGDVKFDRRLTHMGRFEMPLSHYHGIMVGFDMDAASKALKEQIKDFSVDLYEIRDKFCRTRFPRVLHGLNSIEHIFNEMFCVPEEIKMEYMKIKVFELLLFLKALNIPENTEEKPYFYKTRVEKVKAVQRFIKDNADKNFKQEYLADKFDIPLTSMKQCFKSVYGCSIGEWLMQYRMNCAAVLLKNNKELSVTEIASMFGYESPSKFAIAFRKIMKQSPTQYRK